MLAQKKGCFFDSWSDKFDFSKWHEAIEESKIDVEQYIKMQDTNAPLPWSFIDFGVSNKYLLKEYKKALDAKTTNGCKEKCLGCGAKCSH